MEWKHCTIHAESRCKSWPKCSGCGAFGPLYAKDPPKIELLYRGRPLMEEYVKHDIEMTKKVLDTFIPTPTMPKIKDVIFNGPATIVFWEDGVKTVVKAQNGEKFDPEKGLAMAISKRVLGNKRDYYYTFRHFNRKYERTKNEKQN